MRHEQYKLVEVDRETLAIEYETSDFNSPNIHRMFWPIGCYRVETRWQYGQWEKYTKKGWVAA